MDFPGGAVVESLPSTAADVGSIPGWGRFPGVGNGNQYSCLENPMDREAWQTTVLRGTKNQTRLKCLSMQSGITSIA